MDLVIVDGPLLATFEFRRDKVGRGVNCSRLSPCESICGGVSRGFMADDAAID